MSANPYDPTPHGALDWALDSEPFDFLSFHMWVSLYLCHYQGGARPCCPSALSITQQTCLLQNYFSGSVYCQMYFSGGSVSFPLC
jgi:hypothetical protein